MASFYNSTIIKPFVLVLFLLISTSSYSKQHPCLTERQNALLQFKETLRMESDEGYPLPPWQNDTDCCMWDGVTCDNRTGDVISLHISDRWLRGIIDNNSSLFLLQNLQSLNLSYNHLEGSLSSFTQLPKLLHLDLSNNKFEGPIPTFLHLSFLLLSNNNFTGEIPLSICKFVPSVLDLSNNSLNGTIPTCLLNQGSVINLGMNKLEGTIPDINEKNTTLRALDLSNNQLIGPLPRSMVNCKLLVLLNLSKNNIKDSFPYWLGTLPDLQVLKLQSNKFSGMLKTRMDHPFPSLRLFDISNNNLTGFLPINFIHQLDALKIINISHNSSRYLDVHAVAASLYGYFLKKALTMKGSRFEFPKISTASILIDFSNNNFHGEVPEVIGELVALKGLNLSHNNLVGNIPLSVQNLTRLEWLDLSSNKLNGPIPGELTHLTELSYFNVSYNDLGGIIPSGQQFDTFGMESFVGNRELCGSQVAKPCGESKIPEHP